MLPRADLLRASLHIRLPNWAVGAIPERIVEALAPGAMLSRLVCGIQSVAPRKHAESRRGGLAYFRGGAEWTTFPRGTPRKHGTLATRRSRLGRAIRKADVHLPGEPYSSTSGKFFGGDIAMPNDDADLIARLFMEEIPEFAAGLVEIKGIARKPGYRCKIAVYSHDPKVNCIGACVGVRLLPTTPLISHIGWQSCVTSRGTGTGPTTASLVVSGLSHNLPGSIRSIQKWSSSSPPFLAGAVSSQ
jgi:hypothetical protein